MYAQEGLMLSFMQGFPQGTPETKNSFLFPAEEDDLIYNFLPTAALDLDDIMPMPTISEYDLGGGGELFKAPEPILGDPMLALDPVAAAISMMSDDGSIISGETIEVADFSSALDEDLLNEEFYECKRLETPPPDASEAEAAAAAAAAVQSEENTATVDSKKFAAEGPLQKSVNFGCTSSGKPGNGGVLRPKFLGFHEGDPENTYAMRSYSEGDIKTQTLGSNCSVFGESSSFKLLSAFGDIRIEDRTEERRQKIFRYQKKRTMRNFDRKIKYACRKALADSQPRIRGRFARAEDRHEMSEDHEVGKQ